MEQLKEPCELPLEEQRHSFDRLGDLCTSLGLHGVALRYYKRAVSAILQSCDSHVTTIRGATCCHFQLKLAESLSVDRKTLASAIVSVAVTCGDCGDHRALHIATGLGTTQTLH